MLSHYYDDAHTIYTERFPSSVVVKLTKKARRHVETDVASKKYHHA